tara:strand:- start:953 stop:1624 length:672 start_codon:yes stop_codon:yes gene_type:complete
MNADIQLLESKINYSFKDNSLLIKALTHKSCKNKTSYETLEFLGDRVLALIISEELLKIYPEDKEGVLDKKLSRLVDKNACLKIAQSIDLGSYIKLGNTEINSEGNKKTSILANCCESLIGAIYQDGGYSSAKIFVLNYWLDLFENLDAQPIDSKSALQEWSLKKYKELPIYKIKEQSGPDHEPTFTVELTFKTYHSVQSEAGSVKEAEKIAATLFLERNNLK